jgi:hypothetical protein
MGYMLRGFVHTGDENGQEDTATTVSQLAPCELDEIVED